MYLYSYFLRIHLNLSLISTLTPPLTHTPIFTLILTYSLTLTIILITHSLTLISTFTPTPTPTPTCTFTPTLTLCLVCFICYKSQRTEASSLNLAYTGTHFLPSMRKPSYSYSIGIGIFPSLGSKKPLITTWYQWWLVRRWKKLRKWLQEDAESQNMKKKLV